MASSLLWILALLPAAAFASPLAYPLPGEVSPENIKISTPEAGPASHKIQVQKGGKGRILTTSSDGAVEVEYSSYWFTPAIVGGQNVELTIDTGSADFWVLGPDLTSEQIDGQAIYDPSNSSTSQSLANEQFSIAYGEGGNGVSGPVYTDTVDIGGATVDQMPIGSANTYDGLPPGGVKSGFVGLAFQGGNTVRPDKQPTFMEALQPSLDSPVFTTNFQYNGGTLEFGYIDSSLYKGNLTELQIDNVTTYAASWSVEGVHYMSGGADLGTFDLVFDTGGPMTSGPNATVYAYYAQISGAVDVDGNGKSWNVPCDATLPDLDLQFSSGAVATIPGASFINGDNGDGTCQCWFVLENSATRAVIGDPFFTSNFVVFNQAEATISWAPQA
ncbi:MAG: Type I transmembrane sorting receptor [Claussenomyces sp. TS43310]|nr:MAG: Type I transmembrane sorting receptor [Claussenomyces sp. TS43310]